MAEVRWKLAPRQSVWERMDSALSSTAHHGVVLVGAAGVGKTEIARAVARRHAHSDPRAVTRWVAGTSSATHIPFGVFSHLVEVSGAGESAALLRTARETLCGGTDERRLLIAVDDAHNLDTLSATLVHQLAVSSSVRLILTVREGEPAPDAVTALWKDGLLARVDVEPMSAAEATTLLESVLGGPLETSSAAKINAASEGNPLFLRHLVDGALHSGRLRLVEGVWQLRGAIALSSHLSTLILQHLDSMPPAVRQVLEYLAIEEPLTLSDLAAVTGLDAVEQAEAAGAVTVTDRGGNTVVHPAHPLYTECVRGSMGQLIGRRLRTTLVAQLNTRPPEHVSDRLRLAALALGTDAPLSPTDLVVSAYEAMRLGDLVLGEQLARGALDRGGDLAARLPLAHSLAWQGRGRDADDVLAAVDPDTLSQWDLMAWALPKAANQFWMLGESRQAVDLLAQVRSRITEPAARDSLDALAATFALNTGEPRQAIEIAGDVLASTTAQDLAVAWAATSAALASARIGRFKDVAALADRGLNAQHPGLLRFTIGLGQTTAALMDCDLAGAEKLARHYLSFSEFQQPGRAIGDVLLAHVLMARGALREAASLLRQSAAALISTGYSWGPLALMYLAQTLGQQGDSSAAAQALQRAEAAHGMHSALYAPELELARSWTLAAARDVRGAMAAAREAAAVAESSGQLAIALRALHDGVRLGDTRLADQVQRIGKQLDCALAPLVYAHARNLADGDAAGLDAVAASFESHQLNLAAADAASQAAVLHGGAGKRALELKAKNRAAQLAVHCDTPSTPALARVLNPLPLTDRELEIGVMVAEGLTNKAIADRLSVSVRTVEGHIYRACIKLDVPDRAMLAAAISATQISRRANAAH
ncbi:LuxR C-terminal-related transcriptional regulator [Mycolicibacterium mageritense]|uniref:LuxR C-terminal-related transcriptional regulator n=1 Tax=Mycolicibacterium mageritense TaxID=53462 RepID=UPI001E4867C8|nr:LuxR C-terminal-related transcriptional regulator [Mycolicibacterium mageritense]GJJ22882.1 putative regulatory protein, LuxR [Mycolicibacterium mageritense]